MQHYRVKCQARYVPDHLLAETTTEMGWQRETIFCYAETPEQAQTIATNSLGKYWHTRGPYSIGALS